VEALCNKVKSVTAVSKYFIRKLFSTEKLDLRNFGDAFHATAKITETASLHMLLENLRNFCTNAKAWQLKISWINRKNFFAVR
jgi:hypothetical protein